MMSTTDIAISVNNLSKMYRVYNRPADIFWEVFTSKPRYSPFWALRDVNFTVNRGEILGIIGRNGSGKSTLLKILSGTLDKTEGEIEISGRISAILELGTGFSPDLTGRENIRLGCIYQGMATKIIPKKMDWIIEFSELKDFIDQPFKTYSSGMQARLTFATAVSVDPDIFIVDEALAAGDAYFVTKSLSRIREICNSGSTVVFVSHSMGTVTSLCNKVIWLKDGVVHRKGETQPIVREYEYEIHKSLSAGTGNIELVNVGKPMDIGEKSSSEPIHNSELVEVYKPDESKIDSQKDGSQDNDMDSKVDFTGLSGSDPKELGLEMIFRKGPVFIDEVEFLNSEGEDTRMFRRWESMTICVRYHCHETIPEETLGLAIGIHRKDDLLKISHFSSMWVAQDKEMRNYFEADFRSRPGDSGIIQVTIDPIQLVEGEYLFSVGIGPNNPVVADFYEQRYEAYTINILRDGHELTGLVYYPIVKWSHSPNNKSG